MVEAYEARYIGSGKVPWSWMAIQRMEEDVINDQAETLFKWLVTISNSRSNPLHRVTEFHQGAVECEADSREVNRKP